VVQSFCGPWQQAADGPHAVYDLALTLGWWVAADWGKGKVLRTSLAKDKEEKLCAVIEGATAA